VNPQAITYPVDAGGRQRLADELTARGLKPTQSKQHCHIAAINGMIAAMLQGTFDWHRSSQRPVILGPNGEVLGGHHRIIAAHLAGIDLTTISWPQVFTLPQCYRPVYDWVDVLPDAP